MRTRIRPLLASICTLLGVASTVSPAFAQPRPTAALASEPASIRLWDATVDTMLRSGDLELRHAEADTLLSGRTHVRLQQLHRGVPVYGASLTRQTDDIGATLSIFGTTYSSIDVDARPVLTVDEAAAIVAARSGVHLGPERLPTLVVLPVEDGFRLAYRASAFTAEGGTEFFIDARDGAMLEELDAAHRQSAVGTGTGVLGDQKKMSVSSATGSFTTSDLLRPPSLVTFDMRENLTRTLDFLNGRISLGSSDRAADSDNTWTDGASVDAHAYAGYFYDYYFKRFGRRGIDDNNFRMLSLVHTVPRDAVRTQSNAVIGTFYLNAFYAGSGVMVYGEGLPGSVTAGGQQWNFLSGALDVVAHELSHGVTDYTSGLIYRNESGALNESFSDMMGTAVEFYHQPAGAGPMQADYLVAEDVVTPGGIRSMENPAAYGQPDHYSRRVILPLSSDNGGVHINSGIPNQAYYLAIEGGTNRTSGLSVQGVGVSNREQIEKTIYRAFTQMMPANATFAVARAVTIQAATDLYGASSAATRAMTQAWTAVGVN
ncbi:MAG: M4 family metallopeptidase [Vicinamibacterales bacterium]